MSSQIEKEELEEFKEYLKSKSILELALLYKVSHATIYNWIKKLNLWDFYQEYKKDKRKEKFLKLKK